MRVARNLLALALVLVPAVAHAEAPSKAARKAERTARVHGDAPPDAAPRTCARDRVEVVAGPESATFALARCDGRPSPRAIDRLSILARPGGTPRPRQTLAALARKAGPELAPGIRRVDARLVARLEAVVDHFRKPGETPRVLLVSGYRPRSSGSYHQAGRALDFRVDGVTDEALVAFCRTLPDTGCGYYPNSSFVHMDAREPGAGHVAWIDASRPGEPPKYVASWPAPGSSDGARASSARPPGAAPAPAAPPATHASQDLPSLPAVMAAPMPAQPSKGKRRPAKPWSAPFWL